MHRSWSKRLSGAMPLRGEDKAHRRSSHRDEASGSAAAAAGGGRRPTSVYVPTHAASSFVQTASRHDPVNTSSPTANGGVAPPHTRSTQSAKKHRQQTASMDSTMSSLSSSSSSAGMPSDYATFLVEAEANDRAIRSCIAHRRREHDRESSAPHAYAPWPQYYKQQQQQQQQRHSKRQQRDSAYYSIASRSSVSAKPATKRDSMLSMSAHHHPQQQQQQQQQGQGQAPSPRSGLTRKGTKTLGRRISEYFKPPTRHQPVCCEY